MPGTPGILCCSPASICLLGLCLVDGATKTVLLQTGHSHCRVLHNAAAGNR